nr:reverse transcriptase domain-containing protein [Tanacetum cinerariifolium]
MLRACPHHRFSELNQIDTFYNGLNEQDQESLNAAAGGNLLSKTTREALKIIENKPKVCYSRGKSNVSRVITNSREGFSKTDDRIDKLANQILNLVEIVNKQVITPATVKAVEKTCVIYGGAHAYYDCIATDNNQSSVCAAMGTYNQVSLPNRASNQMAPPGFVQVQNNQNRYNQNQGQGNNFNRENNFQAMLLKKLRKELGDPGKFLIPCDFPGMDVCHALADLGVNINLMPLSIWKKLFLPELTPTWMTLKLADRSITRPKRVAEDVSVKVRKFYFPTNFVVADFEADPWFPLILRRSFLTTGRALIDVYEEEITLRVNDESVTFNLNQTMRHSSTYDDNLSGNPTLVSNPSFSKETNSEFCKEPIVKSSSPTLTPFRESDFLLEEIKDFLKDKSIPMGIEDSYYDPEGDVLYLEKLLNDNPSQLPPMDLKQAEETKAKSSIEEPPELEFKELSSHLEYAFLEETDKLPVIIAKDLKDDEKEALLKVLKSHKRAIAWKITDIKGIDPRFYTRKILIEEDYKPAV